MALCIPNTLTVDHSGEYILSIRLCPDGLSFAVCNPTAINSFSYGEMAIRPGRFSLIDALEDSFSAYPFLKWTYKQVNIICVSPQYVLVPESFFDASSKADHLSFVFSRPKKNCLNNPLTDPDAELLFGIDTNVFQFLSRAFFNPYFIHHITAELFLLQRSEPFSRHKRMYVVLHTGMADVICFEAEKLTLINTFVGETEDIFRRHILPLWRQMEMDERHDGMYLFAPEEKWEQVKLLSDAHPISPRPVQIPAKAYLLGQSVAQAPLDIVALLPCAL